MSCGKAHHDTNKVLGAGNGIAEEATFEPVPIIYSYSRRQAIEDGYQFPLTGEHAAMARQAGWQHPVYLSGGVHDLIERAVANKRHCNDYDGVLWDILYMGARGARRVTSNKFHFQVVITGAGRKRNHVLKAEIGATDIDDPAPAITFSLPEED